MPLVVPGLSSTSNKTDQWSNKLLGKTLHDTKHDETNFSRKELPAKHRVWEEGTIGTADFVEDRLNVHVDKNGVVNKVTHG